MDGYPHVICSICLGKLTDFKQFKEQCEDSRDTYNNVFMSEEIEAEHPIDIEELSLVKLEPKDPLYTQEGQEEEKLSPVKLEPEDPLDTEEGQEEIRKSSIALTPLDYLELRQKRTRCDSYGPYRSESVNYGEKPLSKRRKKVAARDADPRGNVQSSSSAEVKVGKTGFNARGDRKSPGDVNGAESSVRETRKEATKRREDASVGSALEGDEIITLKIERDGDTGGNEREMGEEAPLGVEERKNERFKCDECGERFRKMDVLTRHLELHGRVLNEESNGEGREFQANVNDNRGSKRSTNEARKKGLKNKMSGKVKRDEEVRKCVCDSCGQGFNHKSHLEEHLRVHSEKKTVVCAICNKRFSDKSNLKRHVLTHTGEKPYLCKICYKGFAQNVTLVNHMRIHSGEKPYLCNVCKKCFYSGSSLVRHLRIHSQENPFVCKVCNEGFSFSSSLKAHLRMHSQEKSHACEVCNKCFKDGYGLKRHSRMHSQEKPYICQVCKKCFSDSSSLRYHLRIHTQENPYACKVCKKCCRDASNLRSHLRIHSQEKPYVCVVCSKRFRYSSNFRSHIRINSHSLQLVL